MEIGYDNILFSFKKTQYSPTSDVLITFSSVISTFNIIWPQWTEVVKFQMFLRIETVQSSILTRVDFWSAPKCSELYLWCRYKIQI